MAAERFVIPTKTNNPTDADIIRKFFATEVNRLKIVLDNYADLLDSLENDVNQSTSKFYGVWSTLALLQGAHQTADVNGYAIIDPDTNTPPQLALWDDTAQEWIVKVTSDIIQFYETYQDLPSVGVDKVFYIVRDDYSQYLWTDNTYSIIGGGLSFLFSELSKKWELYQNEKNIASFHPVAVTGEMSDLNRSFSSDVFFEGLEKGFNITIYDKDGFPTFLGLLPDSGVQLVSTKSVVISSLLASINIDEFIQLTLANYQTKLHSSFVDRSLIDVEYSRLANAHNSFGKIKFINNVGSIENTLDAHTDTDCFLLKDNTDYYIAIRKTNNLDLSNCEIAIAGDPINDRAVTKVVNPVYNATASTTSYFLNDIAAVDVSAMASGNLYEFTFWRRKVDVPNFAFNISNPAFAPKIHYRNPDNSVYDDFIGANTNIGYATKHTQGAMNFCYFRFTGLTTGAAPDINAQLFIDDFPAIPVAAVGYPGQIVLRTFKDDVGGSSPNWTGGTIVGFHPGSNDYILFKDIVTNEIIKGLPMNNATIEFHFTYITGTV